MAKFITQYKECVIWKYENRPILCIFPYIRIINRENLEVLFLCRPASDSAKAILGIQALRLERRSTTERLFKEARGRDHAGAGEDAAIAGGRGDDLERGSGMRSVRKAGRDESPGIGLRGELRL
jgi:hypothetical protein